LPKKYLVKCARFVFPILQVDPNSLVGDEQLGSKSKFWFEYDAERWLFKLAREQTGEDWAEKVAAEVAKAVPVAAARVELADYKGRRGSASLSFIGEHESLVHGNEILAGQIFGYDRQKKLKQSDHTFDNIVAAVRKLMGGAGWYHQVLKEIARYIVLDALICNTDRHHENWGFLTTYKTGDTGITVSLRMAPSFDHASSLGRELRDERAAEILAANGVATYARRGHGGIYWEPSDHRGANPLQLVELASSKYPDYFREPIAGVASASLERLRDLVDEVPNAVISEPSRRFAKALLEYTHGVLSGLAT
jgi:hypothetical protein